MLRKLNFNALWLHYPVSIWQRLTTPHPALQNPQQRRQAQLFAIILLALAPLGFLSGLLPTLYTSSPSPISQNIFVITSLVLVVVFPIYLLARSVFYRVGVALLISVTAISMYAAIYLNGSLYENPLHYLIIPILLCNLFFNMWATVTLIGCISLAILIVPLLSPTIAFIDLIIGPVRFMLLTAPLLLIFGWYRRQLERDRQAALTQSEHRYRVVSELTSDFTYSLNIGSNDELSVEWVSGDFGGLTGEAHYNDITSDNWMDFIHQDDLSTIAQSILDILVGETVEGELRILGKNNAMRWIQYYARPQWNPTIKRVTHIYGAAKDISDRKASEASELDQRNLAEALRDTAAILNSTLEPETVLDQILANVARVVPHDAGSIMMIENGICRVVRHQDITQHENEEQIHNMRLKLGETPTLHQMYETQRPLLISDVTSFDGWFDIEPHLWIKAFLGTPISIGNEVVGFLTLDSRTTNGFTAEHANRLEVFANQASIAIQNARLYEALSNEAVELDQRVANRTAELDRERRQLRAILDAMGEGMFYTEGQTIVYTNPALSQITGYQPEEMKGQTPLMFGLTSHEETNGKLNNLATHFPQERIWRDELPMRGRDGKIIDSAITVTQASAPGETPARAVAVVRDIGQEKALQAQKRQFVAITSHELRTPLTNINTRLYLIRHQPERMEEHLRVVEEVVKDMQALTEDLLDLARYENRKVTLALQSVVLQTVIEKVIDQQQPTWALKTIHLRVDLPPAPIWVQADVRRLRQVMTNLVTNAYNYTPEEGYVTIQLSTEPEWAVLSITDSGIGIEPEHLPDLFEPFFRIRDEVKGTGLGLSITREIVLLHGGQISVESEPQQGSRFTVRLPLLAT